MQHRELGKAMLNRLASSDDMPWSELQLQADDWLAWRRLLMSPEWSQYYDDRQASALASFRETARVEFSHFLRPSDLKLRSLVDSLAAEAAATLAGRVEAADSVWSPREIVAIAFGLLLTGAQIELDDDGQRSQLPYTTTCAIQQIIPGAPHSPFRTPSTAVWTSSARRMIRFSISYTLMAWKYSRTTLAKMGWLC